MKTHFTEENSDVNSAKDTADDHCWREHQLKKSQIIGDLIVTLVVLIGLVVFVATWGTPTLIEDAMIQGQPAPVGQSSQASINPSIVERDDGR